jgi:AP2-like factor (euAP2 lineage)
MKEIVLKSGKKILLDDEDYDFISQLLKIGFYIRITKTNHITLTGQLHRIVTKFQYKNLQIDHIDRNPLNNQKSNLRLATASQNQANTKKRKRDRLWSSQYKGVRLDKRSKKYVVSIQCNHKRMFVYSFCEEKDAAMAYDILATKYFGEFAYLNFPSITEEDKLRIINQLNNPKKRLGFSKYRGVGFFKREKKWSAKIQKNGKYYFLGYFDSEEDAAIAYNNKAIELYEDKAKLNLLS